MVPRSHIGGTPPHTPGVSALHVAAARDIAVPVSYQPTHSSDSDVEEVFLVVGCQVRLEPGDAL